MKNTHILIIATQLISYAAYAAACSVQASLQTQLAQACRENNPAGASGLINAGADPLHVYARGENLAHISAYHEAKQILIFLAEKTTVDLNAYNESKETPLSIAVRKNTSASSEAAHLLLTKGANPNKPATTAMWTPLMIASRLNNTRIMQSLIEKGANINETVKDNDALSIANKHNCAEAVESLFAWGAQPTESYIIQLFEQTINTADNKFEENLTKLTRCLCRSKKIYTKKCRSLLIEAIKLNKPSVARAIAESCPHYHNTTDKKGRNPLHHLAVTNQTNEDIHACIDLMSALTNRRDADQRTALMHTQNTAVAAHLIALGADIHAQDTNHMNALIYNIAFPNSKIVSLLLYSDAIQNPESAGITSLEVAKRTREILLRDQNRPIIDFSQPIPTLRFPIGYEQPLREIDTITEMLKHPQHEQNNPENAQLFRNRLNLNNRNIIGRTTDPKSFKRLRKS